MGSTEVRFEIKSSKERLEVNTYKSRRHSGTIVSMRSSNAEVLGQDTYESKFGCEHTAFLIYIRRVSAKGWRAVPSLAPHTRVSLTKGVSFGPQINASQVKKSDSEIGPIGYECNNG